MMYFNGTLLSVGCDAEFYCRYMNMIMRNILSSCPIFIPDQIMPICFKVNMVNKIVFELLL